MLASTGAQIGLKAASGCGDASLSNAGSGLGRRLVGARVGMKIDFPLDRQSFEQG
jgi:hypothetical protein